jgi:hypothetical protein|mmetsp:Transcript_154490/g.474809  ORF Transcript_154490/g.474809 Transcript_154490/m.474809 type:complete len:316 (-) Transcript_154490:51-998(-)
MPTPSVTAAAGFDAEKDAEVLRKAMKGLGTDEKAIIQCVCHRSNEQRLEIIKMFKTMYGKDLIKELKSELGGHFEDLIIGWMMPKYDFLAWALHDACAGAGTTESTLIDVICGASSEDLKLIIQAYKDLYNKDLEKVITSETSGHFKRILVSSLQCNRSSSTDVDPAKAHAEAEELFNAGEGKLGTDESCFNRLLSLRSCAQLDATFNEYAKLSGYDIERTIQREMSGDLEKAMLAVVKCMRNRAEYFAERIYQSMDGAGTNDKALIRHVVSHAEVDMEDIKTEFMKKYKKSVSKMIEKDTSGDYKRGLIEIVGQ